MPSPGNEPSAEFLERKLATIVSADVAEFGRLMAENEEEALRTFRSHRQVFESLVAMHRGRVFNTAGDAILAEFSSAVEAVRCATDIQAALRTANDQLPLDRQVRFRIGINLGDVMVHGQDLLGDGVNVAARVQTAAEPGGICISGSVHDQILNKLSLSFESLGELSFKNIQRPVRTFSIIEVAGGVALPSRRVKKSKARAWVVAAVLILAAAVAGAYLLVARNKGGRSSTVAAVSRPDPSAAATSPKAADAGGNPSAGLAAADPERFNGNYSGQICYGETKQEKERCYQAQCRILDGIISSEWVMGPAKKIRAMMAGRVNRSGGVRIEIETHNADDDKRLATITLAGTWEGGLMNATGSFRNGRPATLSFHKIYETGH